jgi:hypothetical protein
MVGQSNCRPRCPVVVSITAGKWFVSCDQKERTTAMSSIHPPTFGNQSETGIPDCPYLVNVRRQGITGRLRWALLSPKPIASMIVPAYLLSFGSKVSMWLTPPHMNSKITDLAFCGSFCAAGKPPANLPSSAQRAPTAEPSSPNR